MFVYLLNIALMCLYALIFLYISPRYIFKGEQTKLNRIFFIILCFFQCLMIATIRYGIGTDYNMYRKAFLRMAESGFSDMKYEDWEIGYILLNKIVGLFTKNDGVFFFIAAALALSGTFYMIWRYSKNPFMSVFLFLNTYLFYLDLNYMRQAIAMSIMCFAYGFLQERKLWKFLLMCALAATFHLPVIYLIPVYFITYIKLNLKTMPIYAAGLIVYFLVSDAVLQFVFSYFHQEYANSRFIKYGIGYWYAIYPLILCVAMVALVFYFKFKLPKHFNVLCHLMLMMGFWQIVMTKHALFERFSYYTMPFMLIAVPEAISMFEIKFSKRSKRKLEIKFGDDADGLNEAVIKADKKLKIIITVINVAVLILTFGYNMLGLILPKYGAHGVLPFRDRFGLDFPNIDSFFKR